MLRLLIRVSCDDCTEHFPLARDSAYTVEALSFNMTVMDDMLRQYDWDVSTTEKRAYHYCRQCANDFMGLEQEPTATQLQ